MSERLSVPEPRRRPPRALTDAERASLHRIADTLIPARGPMPRPSDADGYDRWLDRALAARGDAFDAIIAEASSLDDVPDDALWDALRARHEREGFKLVSTVVAGAYLMAPQVRRLIGYPGQERKHPQFDEAAEQIMDGILDPVIARGRIFTPAP